MSDVKVGGPVNVGFSDGSFTAGALRGLQPRRVCRRRGEGAGPIPRLLATDAYEVSYKAERRSRPVEIKRHIDLSRILEDFSVLQPYKSSVRQCLLSASIDSASLDIKVSLTSGKGPDATKGSSLTHCAQVLSSLLQSTVIDQPTFSDYWRERPSLNQEEIKGVCC